MTTPERTPRGVLAVCSAALVIGTVLQSSLLPLLPRFAEEHHLSAGGLALVAGAYSVGILVAAVPTGALVARYGARGVLAAASATLAFSAVVLVVSDSPTALLTSRCLQGVAGSMAWGAAFPWVAEVAPTRQRGRLIGVLLSAGVVGGLVGPVVPLVGDALGARPTFAVLAAVAAAVATAGLLVPAPVRRPAEAEPVGTLRAGGRVLLGGWLIALVGTVVGTAQVLGALRLDHVGASPALIAGVLMAATGCQTLISPLAGSAADRLGPVRPIRAGLVPVAALLALFAVPQTRSAQAAVVLLCLCCTTVVWGSAVALMSAAARASGWGQGAVFAVVNLGWAAGTMLGTAGSGVVSRAGLEGTATGALALLALVTAALLRAPARLAGPRASGTPTAGSRPGPR